MSLSPGKQTAPENQVHFAIIKDFFHSLEQKVPRHGYYPEPSKSVLILHLENLEDGKLFSQRHGFKVCTGASYLGSCSEDDKSKHDCLKERTETWEWKICNIGNTRGKYPQESYAAVVRAIKSEC